MGDFLYHGPIMLTTSPLSCVPLMIRRIISRRFNLSIALVAAITGILADGSLHARDISAPPASQSEIVVYVARKIVTMEPGQPEATAVAVRDGLIIDVGSVETFEPWIADLPHRIDRRFARKVLLPGFIDPHVHPFLAGKLLTFDIAAPEAWNLPDKTIPAMTTREAYLERVAELSDAWTSTDRPHIVWGWHRLWHGDFTRADLDRLSPNKPLIIWHRSYHEIVANTKALEFIKIPDQELERFGDQINLEKGHFKELGMAAANRALGPITETPEKIIEGLRIFRKLVQRGGVTTVADMMAGGTIGIEPAWQYSQSHLQGEDVPFRTLFIAAPFAWQLELGDQAFEALEARRLEANAQLRWPKAIKSASDGAFISQLMQMGPPGYLDGHEGEWLIPPQYQRGAVEPFWKSGYDIYYHVNGDKGLDVVLDLLETLKTDFPRVDYRFSLEHFGLSRDDQVRRFAGLGGSVSINGYYLHYFGEPYAKNGVGFARASQMTRLGSLYRAGVPFTMHSDLPMGPIEPLLAVTTAVTRKGASGRVLAPEQAVSVDAALRAVTIEAAWSLRIDDEVGSIAPGKSADFAVLEKSPFDVRPSLIRDIGVWGTVYEGRIFENP
jgi:predicted amidohydrolase YtcJ